MAHDILTHSKVVSPKVLNSLKRKRSLLKCQTPVACAKIRLKKIVIGRGPCMGDVFSQIMASRTQ